MRGWPQSGRGKLLNRLGGGCGCVVSPHPVRRVGCDREPVATVCSERFAVLFCEQGGQPHAGVLRVEDDAVLLEAAVGPADAERHRIRFADLAAVRVARGPAERLNGYRVLVLEQTEKRPVRVAALGIGILSELADLLSGLAATQQWSERAAIALPVRPECEGRVRRLVRSGPPFAPAQLGVDEHSVYLTEGAVVFVFVGADARGAVERLTRSPRAWQAGLAWRRYLAGAPCLLAEDEIAVADAELLYRWQRFA
jgi:hypothetical protein